MRASAGNLPATQRYRTAPTWGMWQKMNPSARCHSAVKLCMSLQSSPKRSASSHRRARQRGGRGWQRRRGRLCDRSAKPDSDAEPLRCDVVRGTQRRPRTRDHRQIARCRRDPEAGSCNRWAANERCRVRCRARGAKSLRRPDKRCAGCGAVDRRSVAARKSAEW